MLVLELDGRSLEELMDCLVNPARAREVPAPERQEWLEEVAIRIAQSGEGGISFLLWYMARASAARLRAIFVAFSLVNEQLTPQRRDEIGARIVRFLEDRRSPVVAEVIDALRRLGCRAAADRIYRLRTHPSPCVIGAVLRFFSAHDRKRAMPLLEAALRSASPIIRQNAIDELDDLQYVRVLPRIRRLLDDPDKDVRQAAETAVANLEELAHNR